MRMRMLMYRYKIAGMAAAAAICQWCNTTISSRCPSSVKSGEGESSSCRYPCPCPPCFSEYPWALEYRKKGASVFPPYYGLIVLRVYSRYSGSRSYHLLPGLDLSSRTTSFSGGRDWFYIIITHYGRLGRGFFDHGGIPVLVGSPPSVCD